MQDPDKTYQHKQTFYLSMSFIEKKPMTLYQYPQIVPA